MLKKGIKHEADLLRLDIVRMDGILKNSLDNKKDKHSFLSIDLLSSMLRFLADICSGLILGWILYQIRIFGTSRLAFASCLAFGLSVGLYLYCKNEYKRSKGKS